MRIKNTFIGIITGASLLTSSNLEAAVFAKYDGVDGESADANHDKWIDVLSIDWGIIRDVDPASGQLMAPKPRPFRITKEIDKATPLLMGALTTGGTAPNVVVEFTHMSSAGPVVYLKYELKNVLISSWNASHNEGETSVPSEDFSLNFEEIKVTYTPRDGTGAQIGEPVVSTWSTRPEPQ